MSLTPCPAPAVTPAGLLAQVRDTTDLQRSVDVRQMVFAVAWADAHPDLHALKPVLGPFRGFPSAEQDGADHEHDRDCDPDCDPLVPGVAWDAPAPFAAALGLSTRAGESFIRDALTLRHRLPLVWARVLTGAVPAWRARRIAQRMTGEYADVTDWVDQRLAPIAESVGPVILDRLVDAAMLLLHAEERELAQLEALDARYVILDEETMNDTGLGTLIARGDWKDLHDFDLTVGQIAAVLKALDDTEGAHCDTLDNRRSRAIGVLADPAAAAAMLAGNPVPKTRKSMLLVVHVSVDAVRGMSVVARNATTGKPMLTTQALDWFGRADTTVTVQPVIDLNQHLSVDRYEISDRVGDQVRLTHTTCVFPWCTRPSRDCDADHIITHATGGATCTCNLAPLCRRHHRLKTHAGWTYTVVEPGIYLWREPHGQRFMRNHHGTYDVTPPKNFPPAERPDPWNGCRAGPDRLAS